VPTVAESGYPGFDVVDWKALVAPAGTPADVVRALNGAVNAALSEPDTLAQLVADGSLPMGGSPQQAQALVRAEHARWGALVHAAGITLD